MRKSPHLRTLRTSDYPLRLTSTDHQNAIYEDQYLLGMLNTETGKISEAKQS